MEHDRGVVIAVGSDKTFYRVAIQDRTIRVFGPGVDETYSIGEDIPEGLCYEHAALCAVLLWEDQV
jgi:hypothetical protein